MEAKMAETPSRFSQMIIEMLAPSLGEQIATIKVRAACVIAKLDIREVDHKQKELISQSLQVVCQTLGENTAASIGQRVKEMHT